MSGESDLIAKRFGPLHIFAARHLLSWFIGEDCRFGMTRFLVNPIVSGRWENFVLRQIVAVVNFRRHH
ncbi:MAG: hypothetical protein C0478_11145 [Planctomyces sp.]|nr:hypothetical protein [Planctomyces sp.]